MDFVTKSFWKDETLTSWPLLQHICPHFWAWLLLYSVVTPKSEEKYVVKVFNWSEFHLSELTMLQNPHFNKLPFQQRSGCFSKIIFLPSATPSNFWPGKFKERKDSMYLIFNFFGPAGILQELSDKRKQKKKKKTDWFSWSVKHQIWRRRVILLIKDFFFLL